MRSILSIFLMASLPLAAQSPSVGGCQIFPADNVWNTPISNLPVDANSATYVASMNATNTRLHPDFGSGTPATGGIPYNLVPGDQPKITVPFYYGGDPGPYPIPDNVYIESGSDHHAILVDTSACELYEIFNLTGNPGSWAAGSGAIWALNSDALRPDGLTSADAAGLPILPGLVRYEEVVAGQINHAIRVTADNTRSAHIWPARHDASSLTGSQYPPMGQRFRLKASFDISPYPTPVQVILQALQRYGMILADNGASWYISGVGDPRWNDDTLHAMTQVTGDNFEAVDESSLMIDPNSGATSTSVLSVIPSGWVHIVSKSDGKCLEMKGGYSATAPGVTADQWTCLQGWNQDFEIIPYANPYVSNGYRINIRNSGLSLQVSGGEYAGNGAVLEQEPFSGTPPDSGDPTQIWTINPTPDGYYTISSVSDSSSCVDVKAVSQANGATVQKWECNGGPNQAWKLSPIGN